VQYGALRRKIGGTYKDFFKSYIEGEHSILLSSRLYRLLRVFPAAGTSFPEPQTCFVLHLWGLVDGQYVEEGWVDKTCKICKKDTKGEPRQVDKLGRYVHVACVENSKSSGNFFTRLFSR